MSGLMIDGVPASKIGRGLMQRYGLKPEATPDPSGQTRRCKKCNEMKAASDFEGRTSYNRWTKEISGVCVACKFPVLTRRPVE